ncbi:hypothetical protein Sjap_017331 [Stephania japonica]|uniref:Uncharacterized protein n=1 Tax=Stephania japonica TaxID=461633 RepID=A0AAP0NLV7_9MAGN
MHVTVHKRQHLSIYSMYEMEDKIKFFVERNYIVAQERLFDWCVIKDQSSCILKANLLKHSYTELEENSSYDIAI